MSEREEERKVERGKKEGRMEGRNPSGRETEVGNQPKVEV